MFCGPCQSFWQAAQSKAEIPETATSCQDIKWAPHEVVLHRSIREVEVSSKQKCPICRAILHHPTEYEHAQLFADHDEPLKVVLDIDPSKGPHPVISVTFYEPDSSTPRIAKGVIAACAGLLTDEHLANTLERCGELDNNSTGSDAAFALASFWLKECVTNHEKCRNVSSNDPKSFVPTRLINVQGDSIRLVETKTAISEGDDRRYVALSHCWGMIQIIRTLLGNYEDHLRKIDDSLLSNTFRHAVLATRKLGFKYIWIDSLCIIQDSSSDWASEAATMCDVYRNASLTIAAAHATGGDIGCFQDRDGLLQFPFALNVAKPNTSDGGVASPPHRLMFTSYGKSKAFTSDGPPLYGRAWVLQEQLLSSRVLAFDGPQMRWECYQQYGSERTPLGGLSKDIGPQRAVKSGIFGDIETSNVETFGDQSSADRFQLQVLYGLVAEYTHRGITKQFDKLIAVDGIVQAIQRHTEKKNLAGLWEKDIWLGLLWNIPFTREYIGGTSDAFNLEKNPKTRHDEALGPSWSWASVTVPVTYAGELWNVRRPLLPICEVGEVQVDGTAIRKTGKIKLRGHFRTGYVDTFYQYANREAGTAKPTSTACKADGTIQYLSAHGRSFHPNDFFVFSDKKPKTSFASGALSGSWRLIRGTFRPDEIIEPSTELTFLAIARQNTGVHENSLRDRHDETDPLQIWTLALVATGAEGEYRRVGYAVWDDCSWCGYMCGPEKRRNMTESIKKAEGWRGAVTMGNPEHLGWQRDERHEEQSHVYEEGTLPQKGLYHASIKLEERDVMLV